jgi:hypothetical protein
MPGFAVCAGANELLSRADITTELWTIFGTIDDE